MSRVNFQDLLDAKGVHSAIDRPSLDDLVFNPGREKVIEGVLSQFAEAVKLYATEILNGDFAIFSTLEKIVKNRI